MKLKRSDKVIILSGKDKGKTGIIERSLKKTGQIIVAGTNIYKKHVKVSKKYPSGGTVEIARPIPLGKAQLVCPSCNKPTRIKFEGRGDKKVRICKKCQKPIIFKSEGKEK